MTIVLRDNRYGKAETRLLRVTRAGDRHDIRDLNVTTTLSGDFDAVHLTGDNANVLTTDAQKNTVYAFAKDAPLGEPEAFALRLARHFEAASEPVHRAQVRIEEFGWDRLGDHAFRREGGERRLASAARDESGEWIGAGLDGLVVLRSAGSEFWGFAKDPYTTLPETHDRILATAVDAHWRFATLDVDWARSFAAARAALLEGFVNHRSLSLQQTLFEMGRAVLEARPEISEIRLALPNKHHFEVDLTPFGLANEGEVFFAADRPYGLIEGTLARDGAAGAPAWWEW